MDVLPPFWIWQCHVVARRPIRRFSPVKRNTYLATPRKNSVLSTSYVRKLCFYVRGETKCATQVKKPWRNGVGNRMGDQLRTVHASTCILSLLFFLLLFSLSYLITTCVQENIFSNIYFILTINKSLMYVCWKKNAAQLSRGYYLWPIKFIDKN